MKKLFLILILFNISCSNEKKNHTNITEIVRYNEDSIKKNIPKIIKEYNKIDFKQYRGVFYYKGTPYSGIFTEKYKSGKLKSKLSYIEGKINLWLRVWYPNGQLKFEKFYINGKKENQHQGWFEDGSLKFTHYFKNDLFEGKQLSFYESGQIALKQNFINGYEEGKQQTWNRDGKLTSNYIFKNNRRYGLVGRNDCVSVKK